MSAAVSASTSTSRGTGDTLSEPIAQGWGGGGGGFERLIGIMKDALSEAIGKAILAFSELEEKFWT